MGPALWRLQLAQRVDTPEAGGCVLAQVEVAASQTQEHLRPKKEGSRQQCMTTVVARH
jgi:hypothetical protein